MYVRNRFFRNYNLWVAFCLFVYLAASLFYPKGMFDGGLSDGFYSQMQFIENNPGEFNILSIVHWLRFYVVYPFWWLSKNNFLPIWQNVVLLLYITPLFLINTGRVSAYLRYFLLALPFFLSYRACLTIVSITLLYFYISNSNKRGWPLIFSALLANLSSGVVLPWLAAIALSWKSIKVKNRVQLICVLMLIISMSTSIIHKFSYFNHLEVGAPLVNETEADIVNVKFSCSNSLFCKIISRNTIYVSYITKQYKRFVVYLGILAILLFSWAFCLKNKMREHLFFAISLPGFFFEGLWALSFLVPGILLLGEVFGEWVLRKFQILGYDFSSSTIAGELIIKDGQR